MILLNINQDHITGILIGVVVMFLLYHIYTYSNRSKCNSLSKVVQILVRQAARWATAADQDENPMIAILHANYGAGYLWALQDIATDDQINRYTNVDFQKFKDDITKVQDSITKKLVEVCPKVAPPRTYLTDIGGE